MKKSEMNEEQKTMEKFYEFCLSTCGEKRIIKIKNVMQKSRKILKKDLTKLDIDDVVKFLSHINQSSFRAWTKNDYKSIFKRFLKWCYQDLNLIDNIKVKNAFKQISPNKARNKEKINRNTLIKPEELEKLLRASPNLKWKALFSFMYESGFRPCEIRLLRWKHLQFDDSLNLCRVWTLSPKTENTRTIPIRDSIIHLKRYKREYEYPNLNENDFVFPSRFSQQEPMGEGVITQMLSRICKKAKIRHLFPYLFRHSRIYEIQKKLNSRLSSKFGGHTLEVSEMYDSLDSDDVEESMLKEVFVTEELSSEQKNELEKEIEKLKIDNKEMKKVFVKVLNELNERKMKLKEL